MAARDEDTRTPEGLPYELSIFEALIRNAYDVFVVVDAERRIIFISPSVERILGRPPEAVVGRSAFDLVHPEDLPLAEAAFEDVRRRGGTSHAVVVRIQHEDGTWRRLEAVAQNCLDDPALGGVVINYRDVTEREARTEHLRLLEERYEKAFRNSPDSITITYIDDGRFVEVNEGFERLSGYRREEVVGRTTVEIGIWKDPATRERVVETLERKGRVQDLLADFVIKSGAVRKGLYSAELIELDRRHCLIAVVRDVTEMIASEQRLREAGEQLRREHAELQRKNIALREVLEHLEAEKTAYRQEIAASIDNLLSPVIDKLRAEGGRLTPREIDSLADGLQAAIGGDIDEYRKNVDKLSPREHAICERIRQGRTSKEIAEELGLSEQTIHKHRQSIRRKLQLDRRGINLATYLRSR